MILTCPGCGSDTHEVRGRYAAHPHPTNPAVPCAASGQPTNGRVDMPLLVRQTRTARTWMAIGRSHARVQRRGPLP